MVRHINAKQAELNAAGVAIALAPWLTPLPTAALTTLATHKYIFYELPLGGWLFSIITGLVVELLGFSLLNTYFTTKQHNNRYASLDHLPEEKRTQALITKAKNKRLPLTGLKLGIAIYLVDITFINLLLELAAKLLSDNWQAVSVIVAKGLLIYLSVPAGIVIAARQQLELLTPSVTSAKVSRTAAKKPETSKPSTKVSESLETQLAAVKSLRSLRKKPKLMQLVKDTPTAKLLTITGKDAKTIAAWKAATNPQVTHTNPQQPHSS